MTAAGVRARLLLVTAVVTGVAVPFAPSAAADARYAFAASGLDGGGFQNVVAYSPFHDPSGARPLVVGSDIGGVHRSLDDGRTWQPVNGGLRDARISSLVFSDTVPGKVYAATDPALYVSVDFGQHWSARPGPVNFDGNGAFHLSGNQEHPRSTGRLLAVDDSGPVAYLYAATATQGVKRSSDDGATWEVVTLAGDHLRSLALDPADPDHLVVGDVEKGLQETHDARGAMTFTRVPGGPAVPEELRFVGGALYVAGGTAGIFRYDGAWQSLNAGVPTGPSWESIAGYVDAGQTVLYVGCAHPVGGAHTLKSTDGGATWTPISTGPGVTANSQEMGTSTTWWGTARSYLAFTGKNFVTSDIAVDPDDPGQLVIAGRGGVYVALQSASGISWWPSMRGLMVTVDMVVAADPKVPGRVYVGLADWTFTASDDGGTTFLGNPGPAGAPSVGDYVTVDPDSPPGTPSTVYLAASKRGSSTGVGRIYSNPDPIAAPASWTDEKLPVSGDVPAIGVGHSGSGNRVILASVTGKGLYRKDGGVWAKVSGTAPFASGGSGTFVWRPGTPTVYAMDGRGVWRSTAAGAPGSWVRLLAASAAYANVSSLALDAHQPGVVYVSDADLGGVVRLDGADTATPVRTTLLALTDPGVIAVGPAGELLAQDRTGRRLLRSADPTAGTPEFTDVADAFFADNDRGIRSLSVGPDGTVYTASNSAGVSVAPRLDVPQPPSDTTPPSVPTGLSSPAQTVGSVSLTWQPATDDTAVASYRVLRDGRWVGTAAATDTPGYSDGGLLPGTTYGYSVQAVDTAGNVSAASDPPLSVTTTPDTTAPTGPAQLTARVVSPTQVALSWPAATDDVGVTGYQVLRDNTVITTVAGRSWTDTAATAGPHTYAVRALDAAANASDAVLASVTVPAQAPHGLTGTYFDTATLTTPKVTRIDSTVNFAWGTGSPAASIKPDTFSARWTGRVLVPAAGSWTFVTQSDNGVRLWVDGVLLINNWTAHPLTTNRAAVTLTADRAHDLRLEYFDQTGSATMKLLWSGPGTAQQILPAAQLLAR